MYYFWYSKKKHDMAKKMHKDLKRPYTQNYWKGQLYTECRNDPSPPAWTDAKLLGTSEEFFTYHTHKTTGE